jgi:serine/threonine protein kinase/tetratricopeptide (TPR) repeat protein
MDIGTCIANRFTIEGYAGVGGMATVYRATDAMTKKPVAIKVLRHAQHRDATRFEREAKILAELTHPGIVRHIAHGVTPQSERYLAMEWLDGIDLAALIASQGTLRVDDTVQIGIQVARALHAAHQRGIIHRDVKPANIWLKGGDIRSAVLIDFGVAHLTDAESTVTGFGVAVGTPGYMAPEQARGEAGITPAADLFSLGCVLFECLIGQPAFQGDHVMAVLAKILLQESPRLRDLRADIPRDLDEQIASLLAKLATNRPTSADEVAQRLSRIDLRQTAHPDAHRDAHSAPPSLPALTRVEQRLVSVVLASTDPSMLQHTQPAVSLPVTTDDDVRWSLLRKAVEPFGAHLEVLSDTAVIAMLASGDHATEQVVKAARCARAILAALPNASIVLTTGKAVLSTRVPVGEVIDRSFHTIQSAQPGHVHVDDVTAQLLNTKFDLRDAHGSTVLEHERHNGSAPRTLMGKAIPCVGRDRELAVLRAALHSSIRDPSSCVVLLTGPPGVGKTRIRQEFMQEVWSDVRWHHSEPIEIMIGGGDLLSSSSPFGVLGPAIRRLCAVDDGEPSDVQRYKLRQRISQFVPESESSRITEFLGEIVGIPFLDTYSVPLRAARTDPVLMGDQMRQAWEEWLQAECANHPMLFVFEDLQWGDLPSIQYIEFALQALADKPFMVIALAHPEVHHRFPKLWEECNRIELHLGGLSAKASTHLVEQATGGALSPAEVRRMLNLSQGNAFYLEELIRAASQGKFDALPETVLGMVQSRLDALDTEARRVLRAASIFGHAFERDGIVHLLGGDQSAALVDEWLGKLVHAELVVPQDGHGTGGSSLYTFRHDLIREATYATLTDDDRVLGHKLAAFWLERTGENNATLLAEHFERGEQWGPMVHWYTRAAKDSLAGNDLDAAIQLSRRALVKHVLGTERGRLYLVQAEAHRWKDELIQARNCALKALHAFAQGSADWFHTLGELVVVTGLHGKRDKLQEWVILLRSTSPMDEQACKAKIIALCRTSWQLTLAGFYSTAKSVSNDAEKMNKELSQSDPLVEARIARARAMRALVQSELTHAHHYLHTAYEQFKQAGDIRNECLEQVAVGYVEQKLGQFARAEQSVRSGLDKAMRLHLEHIVAYAQSNLGLVLARSGMLDEGRGILERAIAWFTERGGKRLEGSTRTHLSETLLRLGRVAEALVEAERAVLTLEPFAPRKANALGMLAQARLQLGRLQGPAGALAAAEQGMRLLHSLGSITEGETRLRLAWAECLFHAGDRAHAQTAIRTAYERLMLKANSIDDVQMRLGFLRNPPYNYRTLLLAAEWGAISSEQPVEFEAHAPAGAGLLGYP